MPADQGRGPAAWVVGSINVDMTLTVTRLPGPGETVTASALTVRAGGKGANQAVACARQGVPAHLVARVGADSAPALAGLDGYGVRTRLSRSADRTGTALVMVDETGENLVGHFPGANHGLRVPDLPIRGDDIVVLQNEVSTECNLAAASLARSRGCRVLLNAAPARPLPAELLARTDILIANESEAGLAPSDRGSSRVPTRVVTLGAEGAVAFCDQGRLEQPGFAVPAVDTVGAGDMFTGAFAAATLAGLPVRGALRRACAAAALAVSRPGLHESYPTADEVSRFIEERS